jgi:hypothetical protein
MSSISPHSFDWFDFIHQGVVAEKEKEAQTTIESMKMASDSDHEKLGNRIKELEVLPC